MTSIFARSDGPTVAALELPPRFGNVAGQLERVDAFLHTCPGLDLVLLPELTLTGYLSPTGDADVRPFAEALDGPTAHALADLARKHSLALAGPLVERDGECFYNTLVLFNAAGVRVGHWRKRHPWMPEQWATAGDLGSPVVSLLGLKVTAAICYDVHFVREDAPEALCEADVLLFPSAWVDAPDGEDSRGVLLPALATAFGVWVVNANWGHGPPRLRGQGGSMVVDPHGRITARATTVRGPTAVTAMLTSRGRR